MRLRLTSQILPLACLALAGLLAPRSQAAGGVQRFHYGTIQGKIHPGGPVTTCEGLALRIAFRGITPRGELRFSEEIQVPVSGDGTFEIPAGETKGELDGTRGRGWGEDCLRITPSLVRVGSDAQDAGAPGRPVPEGQSLELIARSSEWSYDDHVQLDTVEQYFQKFMESLHVRKFPGVAGRLAIVRSGRFPSADTAPGQHHPYRIDLSRGIFYGKGRTGIHRSDSRLQGADISPDGSFRIEGGWELVPGTPEEAQHYTGIRIQIHQREMDRNLLEIEKKDPSDEDLARIMESLTAEEEDIQAVATWRSEGASNWPYPEPPEDGDLLRICLAVHLAKDDQEVTPGENENVHVQWFGDKGAGDSGIWFHHDGRRFLYYRTMFYDPKERRLRDTKGGFRSSGPCILNLQYLGPDGRLVGEWGSNRYCLDFDELASRCEAAITENPRFPVVDLTLDWTNTPGAKLEARFGKPAQERLPFED